MKYRTDLAIESVEMCRDALAELGDDEPQVKDFNDGIKMEKQIYDEDIVSTMIEILNEKGENLLGKPIGHYLTLEVNGLEEGSKELKQRASDALAEELKKFIVFHRNLKVLVVGLGNEKVTPDALGPYATSKVRVTRHLFVLFGADGDEEQACVSGFVPGVFGTTGMETAEIVKEVVELVKPEIVIVIDSLAARNIDRISTTIQINDTGIAPGAGMGNKRKHLNEGTLGCKVIAVGVPTVIDARTLVMDTLEGYIKEPEEVENYINQNGFEMIVTSTDIDQVIKDFSDIIASGINKVLHPGIYS